MTDTSTHGWPDEAREALAARCESAPGADRVLDWQIYAASRGIPWSATEQAWVRDNGRAAVPYGLPAYTASLDAALTLVPEGWGVTLSRHWIAADDKPRWMAHLVGGLGNLHGACEEAVSAALALTAAALRARAEEASDEG